MTHAFTRTFTLFGLLLLSACGSHPAPDMYVLRAPSTGASCTPARTITLERPTARDEYDTKRIAILMGSNKLTYYTGAAWASPFPDQLQDFLSDALAQNGITVADADAPPRGPVLHLAIAEAQVEQVDAPVVHLRLIATFGAHKRLVLDERATAAANHMPEIVDAYNQAALQAAQKIASAMGTRCR